MTTHVLIVDEQTFPIHLQYMFAGTGSKEKSVGIIVDNLNQHINWTTEAGLVSMISDCNRIRKGDYVIFYLQQTSMSEGKFFGIFKVKDGVVFADDNTPSQFLKSELGKSLTFRFLIEPYEVYSEGVTEWDALDVIKNIASPYQMLWSLIYRKLKGNRGNTMITIYEANRLFELIRIKNHRNALNSNSFTYSNEQIIPYDQVVKYSGQTPEIEILPRLIRKEAAHKAHEAHLQAYITKNIGKDTNPTLNNAIGITNLEWIGNEVSCGVGMQRIDILLSQKISEIQLEVLPIELKCVEVEPATVFQLIRYVDWIEQYYIPNRQSRIQPVLICHKPQNYISKEVIDSFTEFDKMMVARCLPLKYIEYHIQHNNIIFNRIR